MYIHPDNSQTRVIFPSRAEQIFYSRCQESLSCDWSVFFSVCLSTLTKEDGLKDNEIDFVLYHPKWGIIVIEVKGGRIGYNATKDKFTSTNRNNVEFEIKDPFKQVLIWKTRFVKYLKTFSIRCPVT
ncbi:NERD domain-containing protein, partial [Bacteriovoracaceae bacterium]|nr:NERD domain-containing protein [Bacteriovoracaceae bacterium]